MTQSKTCNSSKFPVLCIGAGVEQLRAIEIAQQMDLHVIAIDGDSKAPGLKVADRGVVIDLRDISAVIQLAKDTAARCILPVPLGSIITTVGAVNDALALTGISAAAASNCTNKQRLAATLEEAGLFTPRSLLADDTATITASAEALGWPVIIKPAEGSGSRGVFVCEHVNELLQWLPWHFQERPVGQQKSQTVIQQFIRGQEVGIDAVVLDGQLTLLMIRDKEVTPLPFRLPYAFLAPTQLDAPRQLLLQETLATACNALQLNHCLIHADVILTEQDQAAIVDISGRPAGFNISSRMAPCRLGFDPVGEMIRYSLGQPADFQVRSSAAAILRFLSTPAGTFRAVHGLQEARNLPGIIAAESFLEPGEVVLPRRCGRSGFRVGYLLARGNNRQEAERYWQTANETIHFHMEQNDVCDQQCGAEQTEPGKHGFWCQDTPEQYPQLSD